MIVKFTKGLIYRHRDTLGINVLVNALDHYILGPTQNKDARCLDYLQLLR